MGLRRRSPWPRRPRSRTPTGFTTIATIPVGRAPHGIRFSADRHFAYVALSGDNQIAVVDLNRYRVVRRLPAGTTPLDLAPVGPDWLVTQFRGDRLIRLSDSTWSERAGKGPSLFAPRIDSLAYLVSEFADSLALVDLKTGRVRATFPTGRRPYPAGVTTDGVLAFVPNRTDGSVSVIDLLNRQMAATVAVCPLPEGGALAADGVSSLVACGGSNEIVYLNTASYQVETRVTGVGPRPFSMTMTGDGRFAVIKNAGGSTVSILDVAARRVIGSSRSVRSRLSCGPIRMGGGCWSPPRTVEPSRCCGHPRRRPSFVQRVESRRRC